MLSDVVVAKHGACQAAEGDGPAEESIVVRARLSPTKRKLIAARSDSEAAHIKIAELEAGVAAAKFQKMKETRADRRRLEVDPANRTLLNEPDKHNAK